MNARLFARPSPLTLFSELRREGVPRMNATEQRHTNVLRRDAGRERKRVARVEIAAGPIPIQWRTKCGSIEAALHLLNAASICARDP